MDNTFNKTAGFLAAPRVLSGIRFKWIVWGVAAYYGLKYLNKRGIMPDQTGAALGFIDKGIDYAKSQMGFSKGSSASSGTAGSSDFITGKQNVSPTDSTFPH